MGRRLRLWWTGGLLIGIGAWEAGETYVVVSGEVDVVTHACYYAVLELDYQINVREGFTYALGRFWRSIWQMVYMTAMTKHSRLSTFHFTRWTNSSS